MCSYKPEISIFLFICLSLSLYTQRERDTQKHTLEKRDMFTSLCMCIMYKRTYFHVFVYE